MRARSAILALSAFTLAGVPQAAAQERLLEASVGGAEPVRVGVAQSSDVRMAPPRRGLFARNQEPLSFEAQTAAGLRAFHLAVYADPAVGRYARGGARDVAALDKPGLKVVDPARPDGAAVCATLMTCLQDLDAAARAAGEPLTVVIEARPAPRPHGRMKRIVSAVFDHPPAAPAWDALLTEIATALPDLDPERLTIVLTGASGNAPPAPEAVLGRRGGAAVALDGAGARVLGPDAAPVTVASAAASGVVTVVLGADWTGEADPLRLGPREAARLGAHVVIVTPETARAGAAGLAAPRTFGASAAASRPGPRR